MQDGLQLSRQVIKDDAWISTDFEDEFKVPGGHHSVTTAIPVSILRMCDPTKLTSKRQKNIAKAKVSS